MSGVLVAAEANWGSVPHLTREESLERAVHRIRAMGREHAALTASDDKEAWSAFRSDCVMVLIYEAQELADFVEEKIL